MVFQILFRSSRLRKGKLRLFRPVLTCAFVRYLRVEPLNSILWARATQRFRPQSFCFPPHCTIPQNDKPKLNSIASSAFFTVVSTIGIRSFRSMVISFQVTSFHSIVSSLHKIVNSFQEIVRSFQEIVRSFHKVLK